MRFIICWIPLLCACSHAVRCDAQLQPINTALAVAAPVAITVPDVAAGAAAAKVGAAAPTVPKVRSH
jgi:hypothetical protein